MNNIYIQQSDINNWMNQCNVRNSQTCLYPPTSPSAPSPSSSPPSSSPPSSSPPSSSPPSSSPPSSSPPSSSPPSSSPPSSSPPSSSPPSSSPPSSSPPSSSPPSSSPPSSSPPSSSPPSSSPTTPPLYTFTTHTFTTAGKIGPIGPTLAEVRQAYSGVTWAQNNAYLNMTTQGIQKWKVPKSGTYKIRAKGAGSGDDGQRPVDYLSKGRDIEVTLSLQVGEVISILVGQVAKWGSNHSKGGSGGTFVVRGDISNPNPILVAGGGGGLGYHKNFNFDVNLNSRSDAAPLNTINGNNGCGSNTFYIWYYNYAIGGQNGGGGENSGWASGGSGLLENASSKQTYYTLVSADTTAKSFKNGGTGADPLSNGTSKGGFGGGGAADGGLMGGGGGGYSGGGAGGVTGSLDGDFAYLNGGGGGSYGITGSIDYGATNKGDGSVTITLI
jgi:hypothetical protein